MIQKLQTPQSDMPAGWIFFDAECRFCVASRRRWGRIFERRGFVWVPLQTPGTAERLGVAPGTADGRDVALAGRRPPAEWRGCLDRTHATRVVAQTPCHGARMCSASSAWPGPSIAGLRATAIASAANASYRHAKAAISIVTFPFSNFHEDQTHPGWRQRLPRQCVGRSPPPA